MSELIYCTYLTVYTGNKLPPFYIGSTSVDSVINKGYRGSVQSEKYKSIWKQELYDHPDLFKTSILTRHETRQEAMEREIVFQEAFSVASNPMYINMAHANGKFFNVGPRSPETKAKQSAAQTGKKRGPHSPETKAKIGAANKGKKLGPQSPEHKAKVAAGNTGKNRSPETRAKQSAARTGKKQSPETIAKMTGQKHTPETRAKMSAAKKGKKLGPQSPEHKAKMTGKKRSPETKAKISAGKKGKKLGPQSPEHKAKIAAARTRQKRGPNKKKS